MLDHERPIGPGTVFDRCAPDSRRSAGTSAVAPECQKEPFTDWRASLIMVQMRQMRLTDGRPDEPDCDDWVAICNTPGPRTLVTALFRELAGFDLPGPVIADIAEGDDERVHTIWCGTNACGVKVVEIQSTDTTALPMYCSWETYGIAELKVVWTYKLEYSGQLGYVAFRHDDLQCSFDTAAVEEQFTAIWRRIFSREPMFEAVRV